LACLEPARILGWPDAWMGFPRYGGRSPPGETERAALKKTMREAAVKAGINTETWLQSVVIQAPKVLRDAVPDARQRMNSAITAWALDLSAGHPTRHGDR
jgi:hypothetical protein